MKSITLSREEYRRWAANQLALMAPDGTFVRYASKAESARHGEALRKGLKVGIKEKDENSPNGYRVLTPLSDRERIKNETREQHGDCMIRFHGNRRLGVVRVARKENELGSINGPVPTPDPDQCMCAQWHGRVPGRHHRICRHNAEAPLAQRGDIDSIPTPTTINADSAPDTIPPDQPSEESEPVELVELEPGRPSDTIPASGGVLVSLDSGAAVSGLDLIPEPADCVCIHWARPANSPVTAGHHPICVHFEPWNRKMQGRKFLATLDGETLREATSDEVAESKASMDATGTPIVNIDDESYLVTGDVG